MRAPALAHARAMFAGSRGVDGMCALGLAFGGVHGREGRTVDHQIAALDDPLRRVGVGDVPLRRGQGQHIEASPAGFGGQSAPDLPACAADHDPLWHPPSLARRGCGYRLCAPDAK